MGGLSGRPSSSWRLGIPGRMTSSPSLPGERGGEMGEAVLRSLFDSPALLGVMEAFLPLKGKKTKKATRQTNNIKATEQSKQINKQQQQTHNESAMLTLVSVTQQGSCNGVFPHGQAACQVVGNVATPLLVRLLLVLVFLLLLLLLLCGLLRHAVPFL